MAATYSIIIPAYNEEGFLPETLVHVKKAMAECAQPGEIIVVDNNSTDRTASIAGDAGAKVVFEPFNQISRARNAGAKNSIGKHLVFLDADTIISPELLGEALKNLECGSVCGGGTTLALEKKQHFLVSAGIRFWNWFSPKMGVAAGCFVYCLREGFEAVGGFNEKVFASEELWFSRQLRKWGKKRGLAFRVIKGHPAITSGRKFDWYSTPRLMSTLLMIIFPFLIYSKSFCSIWYERPEKKKREHL